MGIVKLTTENPKLSFIIGKNPESGILVKEQRGGYFFGFYPPKSNGQEYMIHFKNGPNRVSYPQYRDTKFEYIDVLRYASPQLMLDALKMFFRSGYAKQHSDDSGPASFPDRDGSDQASPGYLHTVSTEFCKIDIPVKKLEHFQNYFPDVDLQIQPLRNRLYRVGISTRRSLYYLLNYVNVFFTYIMLLNADFYDVDEGRTESVVSSMNVINADYFIRYLIKSRMVSSPKLFEKLKSALENGLNIQMVYGSSHIQRKMFIESLLSFSIPIADIGCGDGFYAIPFAKKLVKPKLPYFAMDIDTDSLEQLRTKIKKNGLENIQVFEDLDTLVPKLPQMPMDVLITEVVEHMEQEPGKDYIRKIMSQVNWNKILITTPNRDFNKYYLGMDGFRHWDHKWEANREEWKAYVEDLTGPSPTYKVQMLDIGDRVEDVTITQGVLFSK